MKRDDRLVRLSWDHHHALVFARRIATELDGLDGEGLARLYSDLVAFWSAGLLPHFRGEQECLLARLIRHVAPEDPAVARTHSDHLYLEGLVATMRDSPDEETRREALRRFGETLRVHVRWEEDTLFPLTQEQCDDDDLDAMARDFDEQLPPLAPAPPGG
ncbi:MAG: hemerythrin domain-containing protein [Dehalococcoidia bacterium]|nr:hemerythrin domain-containing protein [Dehalococcoidia bacterium]